MGKTEGMALAPQAKANSIRTLFNDNRVKGEIAKALPKHMTADKLIRVAMTSIQRNPKLLDCTQQSLLGCIMTSAALGLEPDPFLGQAYFVPYWNAKKNCYEAQFMPGYRGYIALARRSGELQSVSSQVVHERDSFILQYGLDEKLEHIPADGDRGGIKGAYVIFRYKDGGYSFDYMTYSDIKAIAMRSKTYNDKKDEWSGPWSTDEGEMCKKTVIKRHAKLTPMSVDFNKASALEDLAHLGESQMDLLASDAPGTLIEMSEEAESGPTEEEMLKTFADSIPKGTDMAILDEFIKRNAEKNKTSPDAVKIEAVKRQKEFWQFYGAYQKTAKAKAQPKEAQPQPSEPDVPASVEQEPPEQAPMRFACPDGGWVTDAVCRDCKKREGCPVR
jgi:recombination protein RecT